MEFTLSPAESYIAKTREEKAVFSMVASFTQNEKAFPHFLPVRESVESNGNHMAIYLCFWQIIIIMITSIYRASYVRRRAACVIT